MPSFPKPLYRSLDGALAKAALGRQSIFTANRWPCLRPLIRHHGEYQQDGLLRARHTNHGKRGALQVKAMKGRSLAHAAIAVALSGTS